MRVVQDDRRAPGHAEIETSGSRDAQRLDFLIRKRVDADSVHGDVLRIAFRVPDRKRQWIRLTVEIQTAEARDGPVSVCGREDVHRSERRNVRHSRVRTDSASHDPQRERGSQIEDRVI